MVLYRRTRKANRREETTPPPLPPSYIYNELLFFGTQYFCFFLSVREKFDP